MTWHELKKENDKLRYLLAKGSDPCIYCGLSKDDMARCHHGFPGCARGDDLMLEYEITVMDIGGTGAHSDCRGEDESDQGGQNTGK